MDYRHNCKSVFAAGLFPSSALWDPSRLWPYAAVSAVAIYVLSVIGADIGKKHPLTREPGILVQYLWATLFAFGFGAALYFFELRDDTWIFCLSQSLLAAASFLNGWILYSKWWHVPAPQLSAFQKRRVS